MPDKLLDVLQNLLVEHHNKAHLSCHETCFCWSVQELIASVAEDAAQQSVQSDGALCEDCGKNSVMEGCSVCAECGL